MNTPVIDLVKDDDVRMLAARDVILRGHELWGQGEVLFGVFQPNLIEASVSGAKGGRFSTQLCVRAGRLLWSCDCSADSSFCAHLVATALDAQREGRGDIYKAAGIIIRDRRMLVERSVGKPAFIAPGGRIQHDESAMQALVRELKEEFGILVDEGDLEMFGRFSASAANHPKQMVHMDVFMVKQWHGNITPQSEVEEIRWLTSELPQDITVGSIFAHDVLPKLQQLGLVN